MENIKSVGVEMKNNTSVEENSVCKNDDSGVKIDSATKI